ncbi:MAG: SPOR domain-containing protein [Muribaculum sp.]|nr:SPOR domain-containing protein [Muribaculum sp.]
MKISFYISAMLLALSVFGAKAQYSGSVSSDDTIIEHIEEDGNVAVNMPDELLNRLRPVKGETEKLEEQPKVSTTSTPTSGKMGGYRIQVFSDNNAQTAKAEASARARNVSAKFPEYATYVVFSSPYWRLRVGNFRTQEEANNAAHLLKEAFPSYSREIRVVRDRITVGK